MLLCVAVFFSGLVNFEVRFLFYVGAFGESLSFDASRHGGTPQAQGSQRTTIFTTGGLIHYEYCLSLTLQSSQHLG
jgi:hypothetical protein